MAEWRFNPIGVIRSPFATPSSAPIQPVFAEGAEGRVELLAEYAAGLDDIDGFSHVHLLYVFHRVASGSFSEATRRGRQSGVKLRVRPYLQDIERGVFATRAPTRPNPIGMSVVRLVRREGNLLHIADVDILDGTPLLDIKPFSPRFDERKGTRSGWLGKVDEETAWRRGRRAGAGRAAGQRGWNETE